MHIYDMFLMKTVIEEMNVKVSLYVEKKKKNYHIHWHWKSITIALMQKKEEIQYTRKWSICNGDM